MDGCERRICGTAVDASTRPGDLPAAYISRPDHRSTLRSRRTRLARTRPGNAPSQVAGDLADGLAHPDAEHGQHDRHAYIGEQRLGTLAQSDAAPFAEFFIAAELFDEDLVLRGALIHTADGVDILQIPLPNPARRRHDRRTS